VLIRYFFNATSIFLTLFQVILAAADVELMVMTKTPNPVKFTADEWVRVLERITPQIMDTNASPIKQRR